MKQTPFNKALQDIHKISMTPAEKQAVLARIKESRNTISDTPVAVYPSPVKSPWTTFSFSSWIRTHRFVTGVAAFLIVAISSNSIVLAANEALPGDALYTLKVNVAEPIRVALAVDPVKKAEIQTSFVQARFEEAEVLAARGELDDEKEKEISDRIDQHIAAVSKNVEEVQKTSPEKAEDANIAVEASMNAHSKILDTLESRRAKMWSSNTNRIAIKARETAKKFEVNSDDVVTLAVAPEAPVAMMMSIAATAPAPEADISTFSAPVETEDVEVRSVSSRMMKSAPVENTSNDLKDDFRDKDEDGKGSSTSTPMTIELKKQKKEREVYEKARQRLDKEFKKEELRASKGDSDKDSDNDSDDRDNQSENRDKGDWRGKSGNEGLRK